MSDKDYNSISKNLKQQIDILKTGNELTGSTACSDRPTDGPQSGPPVTRSGGEKDKLGIDTAQKVVGDTSDQTIGGIGIGSSDSRGSAVGDRSAASTFDSDSRGSAVFGGDSRAAASYGGDNIKIHDRLLKFTTVEKGDIEAASTNFFLDYYYYIYLILLIVILFLIYIFIKLLKPSYIYKNVLRENKKNKYVDRSAASFYEVDINIDYNKMYNIISVIYIVILILLFVNKQKIDYTIEYILKKIY